MGKKVFSQGLVKISKDDRKKQQFNSLIKVLRPKVYITDSSCFKKLVQELTGNNGISSITTLSPPPLELEPDNIMIQNFPETSFDASVSTEAITSNSSSYETCYDAAAAALMSEEFNQVCNQNMFLEECSALLQDSMANYHPIDHLLEYQNVESLLFDVDPNPLYNCYAQIEQQGEVSIYD